MTTEPALSAAATPTADRPLRELPGVVERITYQNPETGAIAAQLAPERTGRSGRRAP